jgi:hypothetical protein
LFSPYARLLLASLLADGLVLAVFGVFLLVEGLVVLLTWMLLVRVK